MAVGVKSVILETNLNKQGIIPDDVGSHSLRAGDSMALKLNEFSDIVIKKLDDGQAYRFSNTYTTKFDTCQ